MSSPAKPKRTRLSPKNRRNQLLDSTQTIISSSGLSTFTMELLAKSAKVSNPLVYKYFETRLALLQELLVREYSRFIEQFQKRIDSTHSYEEVVKLFVTINFDQYSKGNILTILRSQRDINSVLDGQDQENFRRLGGFLIQSMASKYEFSTKQAQFITHMASAASIAAAEHCHRTNGNRVNMIDATVDFIFNGISAFRR